MFIVADVYFSSKLFTAVRQAASIENVRQSLFQGTAIATKGAPVIQPALPVHTVNRGQPFRLLYRSRYMLAECSQDTSFSMSRLMMAFHLSGFSRYTLLQHFTVSSRCCALYSENVNPFPLPSAE